MSFEQPVYSFSYPGGEPPTPTSPAFFLNSLQTPRQDSAFHGPYSPWSPTFASAASPNLKTPTRLSFGTPAKGTVHSTLGKNVEAEIASHVHRISQDPNQPGPREEPSSHLFSSPNPPSTLEAKRRRLDNTESSITPLKTTFEQEAGHSMNSAGSMQTPPPTSTSASRRKAQQAQVARLVKESADKGRRMSFPALAKMDNAKGSNSRVEESPQQLSALQFSPEGFGFQTSGSATAPVYPQHKLFWDPEQSGDDMNIDLSMDDTFTTFGGQKTLDPFSSSHEGRGIQFPTSPGFNLLDTPNENVAPFSASSDIDPIVRASSSAAMARKPSRGNGVDPSLLFSSPGRASEASSMPSASQPIQDDNLLPYAHQLRDAQMELEMEISRKPKRKRGPETDSPAVQAALQTLRDDQAGVKRDLADDVLPSSATQRPSSRASLGRPKQKIAPGDSAIHRQRSKNHLQASQNDMLRHKRTSVTLTIDAHGRAKTETRVLADDGRRSSGQMEMDCEEDSDSTSSSSNDEMVMSQTQSFVYPKQKQPKLGRFTHNTQSHSQRSSYTSTLDSSGRVHTVSENTSRRPSSNLFIQSNVQSRHARSSFNDHSRDEDESEAETIIDSEDDKGDAQSALKKVLESRQNKAIKRSMGSGSKNPYVEQRGAYPSQSAPSHPYYTAESRTPTHNRYNQSYNNISPTTITDPDLATPSSSHSNISSDGVRCVCHSIDDDGQLMIQCESCRKWQHVLCLGLPSDTRRLPAVHLCVFCTTTPNVRGGRVREPARAAFPPPGSPLAHKSHRYR